MDMRFLRFTAALFLLSMAARAEVVTQISRPVAQVGQPVALVYRFINTPEPENMPEPSIFVPGDGLAINFQGASRQSNFSFGFGGGRIQNNSESVIEFTYVVTPLRPGKFTIPGFEVRAGGQQIRTKPAVLEVVAPAGYAPPAAVPPPGAARQPMQALPVPPQPQRRGAGDEAFFGELVMGAKTAYVGEVVPVELRFYFRGDIPLSNLQPPTFGGDGFTAVPLGEPEQTEQSVQNIPYRVFTFRSAITAVKTGEITIPAIKMPGTVVTSGAPPGFDAFFDQFFRNMPMPGMGRQEQIEARTREKTLQILPLPKGGRPANFSGAIGQFTLESTANPRKAAVGEPVTLQLSVSGRGNFDAMASPSLTGDEGWRTYAPKEDFTKTDAIGFGGTKNFDFNLVARSNRSATPGAEFSYFDPSKKEYIMLTAAPIPIDAAGRETAGSDQDTLPPLSAAPSGSPTGAAAAPADDVAAPAASMGKASSFGFVPQLRSPWFLWINLALLAIFALALPLLLWLKRRALRKAQTADLEKSLRQARATLQKSSDRAEFYTAAAHFVQAQLEMGHSKSGSVPDTLAELQRRISDPIERRDLESILARRDELKYGGTGSGGLDPEEHRHVVALLDKFAAHHE